MKLDASLVRFRPMLPDDVNFVKDSWLKSFRDSPWAGVVPNNLYTDTTNEAIEQLLARGAKVEVVSAAHDDNKILAWCCSEPVINGVAVHYVYVKDPYRRKGLASALLERARGKAECERPRCLYTFRTRPAQYFRDWQHCPEVARRR